MKAMVLRRFGGPLQIEERPEPVPGPGEVVVRVRACGMCFTDIKIINGWLPEKLLPDLPHIPGHEPAGDIAAVGPGVQGVKEGDRVAVYFYAPCRDCSFCRSGFETSCERLRGQIGFTVDGGYAEYLRVPVENVAKLADHVPYEHGAVVADAVSTPLQGLRDRVHLKPGETVLVIGVGGLGLHAVQVAKLSGATVLAMDVVPTKLELATRLGADKVFDSQDEDVIEQVLQATDNRGADVVTDLVGIAETIHIAHNCLRDGGRLLMLGYDPETALQVPTPAIVLRQLTIVGSRASTIQTFRDTVRLINEGRISPVVTHHFKLEEANEALGKLKGNQFEGRAVLHLD